MCTLPKETLFRRDEVADVLCSDSDKQLLSLVGRSFLGFSLLRYEFLGTGWLGMILSDARVGSDDKGVL